MRYGPFATFVAAFLALCVWGLAGQGATAQPTLSKVFSPSSIGAGSSSRATFTITNGSGSPVSDLAFTDTLPAAVTISASPNAASTCLNANLSAPASGTSITLSGGDLAASSTCTVAVDVTSSTPGTHTNPAVTLSSSAGSSMSLPVDLTVVTTIPSFRMSFAPASVSIGGRSTLTFLMDNTLNAGRVGSLDFTATLPAGLSVASPSNAATTCISASAPDTTLTASGSSIVLDANGFSTFPGFEVLAAGATCNVTVDVTASGVGTLRVSSALLADFAAAGSASADLTVTGSPSGFQLTKSFTDDPVAAGGTVNLRYSVSNTSRSGTATGGTFSDDLDAALSGLVPASTLPANFCGAGSGATFSGGVLTLTGLSLAPSASCTVDMPLAVPGGAGAGSYPGTTSAISGNVDGNPTVGNAASDSLFIAAGTPPVLAKSFVAVAPNTLPASPGDLVDMQFTITNNNTGSMSSINFIDELGPFLSGLVTGDGTFTPPGPGFCAGTGNASVIFLGTDRPALQVNNVTLAGGGSCTFTAQFSVPSATAAGNYTNTTGAISGDLGGSVLTGSTASATLQVGVGASVTFRKAFGRDSVATGQSVPLTFTIQSSGDSSAVTGIAFTDDLQNDFVSGALVESIDANDCGGTTTGVTTGVFGFSGGSLDANGDICTIDITVRMPTTGFGTGIMNTTSALTFTAGAADSVAAVSDSIDFLTYEPPVFTKRYAPNSVLPGQTIDLTFSIRNNNAVAADITQFTDPLSASLPGLAATASGVTTTNTCGGTISGTTTLTYSGGTVAAGATCVITVPVLVPSGASDGDYTNTSSSLFTSISGNAYTSSAARDTLTVDTTLLRVTGSFAVNDVDPGGTARFVVTIQNNNPSTDAQNVQFTYDIDDNLPGSAPIGFPVISATCPVSSISYSAANRRFTVRLSIVGQRIRCTVTFNFTVGSGVVPGDYPRSTSVPTYTLAATGATVYSADAATATLRVTDPDAPVLGKSFDGPTGAGQTAQLTFVIDNPSSTATAADLSFTDDLGAMLPGATASGLPSQPCGAGSSLTGTSFLSLSGGTVPPSTSCTFSVTVNVPSGATPGNKVNTTSFLRQAGSQVNDPATATLVIEPAPALTKLFTPDSIDVAQTSRMRITIDNSASSIAATNLMLTDNFPAGIIVATPSNASTTCTGGTINAPTESSQLTYNGGTVAAGATCIVEIDVEATAHGTLTNVANLTSFLGTSAPASDDLVVAVPAPLTLVKSFDPTTAEQGQIISMEIEFANPNTFVTATGVVMTDNFPPNALEVAGNVAANGCGSGNVTRTLTSVGFTGRMPPGQTCTMTVPVRVTAATNISNQATLNSSLNPAAATDDATVNVTAATPPTFTKSFSSATAVLNEPVTMTLSLVSSNNYVTVDNIALTDTFPAGLVLAGTPAVSGTGCTGTATGTAGGDTVAFSGSLAPLGTCTVTVSVLGQTGGAFNNVAGFTSDLNGTAVTAGATLTVSAGQGPDMVKTFSAAAATQGETLTMTIAMTNPNGFTAITDVDMTDPFPAALQIASAPTQSAGCTGGMLTGTVGGATLGYVDGTIGIGQTCTITVGVTAIGNAGDTNTASVTSEFNATATTASRFLSISPAGAPLFAKTFSTDTAEEGQSLTMTLTVENQNAFQAVTDLAITDAFPAGLQIAADGSMDAGCTAGTLTAASGGTSVTLADGRVEPMTTCTITVPVVITGSADITNTASMTSNLNPTAIDSVAQIAVGSATGPQLAKAFGTSTAELGGVLPMTITLTNPNAFLAITNVVMTDNFPAGLVLAAAAAGDSGCADGTVTGEAGNTTVTFTGSLAIGATCTITMQVTPTQIVPLTNVATVTSDFPAVGGGGSAGASASLAVIAVQAPTLAKTFSASSAIQGESLTMSIAVTNPNTTAALTGVSVSDSFPAGLILAAAPSLDAGCTGGTLTGSAGGARLDYSGGTIAAGAVCTVSAAVTVTGGADVVNTATVITDQSPSAIESVAEIDVIPAPPPGFAKVFAPATIFQFDSTRITYSIDNSGALVAATGLAFSDTFSSAVVVTDPASVSSTCAAGSVSATPGSNTVSFSGGTVAAGESCQISLSVTGNAVGTFSNASGALTSSLGDSGSASATLTVQEIVTGELTIVQEADPDGVFSFTSSESLLNFQIQTVNGIGSHGPITLTAGEYDLQQVVPDGFGNLYVQCTDDNSVGDRLGRSLKISLQAQESLVCTFKSLKSDQRTIDVINKFLMRRADLILSSEPAMGRRIDRLNRGFGNSTPVTFATGDLVSMLPFKFDPLTISSKDVHVSGSMLAAREAAARAKLAHGAPEGSMRVDNYRWDAWFEAQYKTFDDSNGSGNFAIAYFGVDYLMNENLLVGAMLQIDYLEENSTTPVSNTDGTGWMFGPYVTARLAPSLYFDARVAAGRSTNNISPFGTGVYTDQFETDRWLAMFTLTGEFEHGPWMVRPNASLAYFAEKQESYVDALGVTIPSQTVEMGQLKFGPTFAGTFDGADGLTYQPTFSLEAIYNMGHTLGVVPTTPSPLAEGWRGRAQAGIAVTTDGGARVKVGATYDGLFRDDYETIGLTFDLSIPLAIVTAR